jgi:hypothetical protein
VKYKCNSRNWTYFHTFNLKVKLVLKWDWKWTFCPEHAKERRLRKKKSKNNIVLGVYYGCLERKKSSEYSGGGQGWLFEGMVELDWQRYNTCQEPWKQECLTGDKCDAEQRPVMGAHERLWKPRRGFGFLSDLCLS